jgi:hypothetical protein
LFNVIGQSSRLDIGVIYCTRLVPNDMTVIEDEHVAGTNKPEGKAFVMAYSE